MERETGIEPAPSAWKAEVLPLNYSRAARLPGLYRFDDWWREVDSNHRRRKPADLQSAPVGRLGIPPVIEEPVKQPVILEVGGGHVNAFRKRVPESPARGPDGTGRDAGPDSDVEPEMQDIALLDPVFLALQPQAAGLARARLAALADDVVV